MNVQGSDRQRIGVRGFRGDVLYGLARSHTGWTRQLVPRTVRELFKRIDARRSSGGQGQHTTFRVKCSFVQIYNEQVYDLFNATHLRKFGAGPSLNNSLGRGLRVRWSTRGEFYIENLFIHECSSADEVIAHFHAGLRRKIMASHRLNAASSRSHCLFALHVCRGDPSRCVQ